MYEQRTANMIAKPGYFPHISPFWFVIWVLCKWSWNDPLDVHDCVPGFWIHHDLLETGRAAYSHDLGFDTRPSNHDVSTLILA